MGYYLIVIASLFSMIFAFVMMVMVKQNPPEAWRDWCYSNSRFAKWLEKKRENSRILVPLHIDRFRLVGFAITIILFIISLVFLLVDVSTGFLVTHFLGATGILTILLCNLFISPLYEAFLIVWWSIIDKFS